MDSNVRNSMNNNIHLYIKSYFKNKYFKIVTRKKNFILKKISVNSRFSSSYNFYKFSKYSMT